METYLAEIAEDMGREAPHIWNFAIKEVWVDIIEQWITVFALVLVASLMVRFKSRWMKFKYWGIIAVAIVFAYALAFHLGLDNIATMSNVEYHAIEKLPMVGDFS